MFLWLFVFNSENENINFYIYGAYWTLYRSVGIDLKLDDFQKVSDKVPLLADLKPSGKYVMEDLHKVIHDVRAF